MQAAAAAGAKRVYIALGANVGDRAATLRHAVEALNAAGIRVARQSSLYETEPVDAPPQPLFLNAVVQAETSLMPRQLLHVLLKIERAFGRRRMPTSGAPPRPRTLDLDILFYGTSIVRTPELEIPHPRLALRRFVLVPLAEIAPELRHPVLHRTMAQLLADAPEQVVRRWRMPSVRKN